MKALVLYRPNSEFARMTEMFIRDFQYQHGALAEKLETIDVDTRSGAATASLYDVVQYPAVLVVADDGVLIKDWQGSSLPLLDELAGYLYR